MKRLYTGLIVLDTIDIICISFFVGSSIVSLVKIYRKEKLTKPEDPIVAELKEKSLVIAVSTDGKTLKLPLVRGGQRFISLGIENKKLTALIMAIVNAKKGQKLFRFLQITFFIINGLSTSIVGLRFALGGTLDCTQVILIVVPSMAGGILMRIVTANPLVSVLLPIGILYGRGIEDIPNPYKNCQILCKVAEEFHNKQLAIEMIKLNSVIENPLTVPQLPFDPVSLVCVEQKLSLF